MDIDKGVGESTTTLVPSKSSDTDSQPIPSQSSSSSSHQHHRQASISSHPSSSSTNDDGGGGVGGVPQPLPVGREFVRQFYNMMGKSPKNLYRFYSINSTLTFGNNPILVGQDNIRRDIERRGLRNCHAYIIKIDSQPTLGNGIVVQVIGELSNDDEPMRPFTQTFVLSPLAPMNFYVYNEIFRYQDEVYREINLEALRLPITEAQLTTTTTADRIAPATSEPPSIAAPPPPPPPPPPPSEPTIPVTLTSPPTDSSDPLPAVVFLPKQSKPKANYVSVGIKTPCMLEVRKEMGEAVEKVHITSLPETNKIVVTSAAMVIQETASAVSIETQTLAQPEAIPSTQIKEELKTKTKTKTKEEKCKKKVPEVKPPPPSSPPPPPPPPPILPLTYANVFKSSSGLLQRQESCVGDSLDSQTTRSIFIRSAIFTSSTSSLVDSQSVVDAAAPSQSTRMARKSASAKNASTLEFPSSRVDLTKAVKSACFQQQNRRSRTRRERYGDGLQIFLGNLPIEATVTALSRIFKRYGNILELRILSKPVKPGMRRLPNYGFLTFDTRAAVQRCLADVPFYFPENTSSNVKLNVRAKNNDEDPPPTARSNKSLATTAAAAAAATAATTMRPMMSYDSSEGRRLDRRRRTQNDDEENLLGDAETTATVSTLKKSVWGNMGGEGCSLQIEDWPELCSPHNDGGGGGCSSAAVHRRKK